MKAVALAKPLNKLDLYSIERISKKHDPYDRLRNQKQVIETSYSRFLYLISFVHRMGEFMDNYNEQMNQNHELVEYTNYIIRLLTSQFRSGVTEEKVADILEFADLDDFDMEMLKNIRELLTTKGINYNNISKQLLIELKK